MITRQKESKTFIKHISCNCKCKFDSRKCNSKQNWNDNKCQCKCKKNKINSVYAKSNMLGIPAYVFVSIIHWVKNVQIRSYFWSVFSCIRAEYGDFYGINLRIQSEYRKIRPEVTPYLDTLHAVIKIARLINI